MRHRLLMLCGILGGILRPDYSQKAQAVSELIEAGVPNKGLLNPLFALYNLLTCAFGLGLFVTVRASRQTERRLVGSLGALALVFEAVVGFLTTFFPQDPRGAVPTFTGATHIALAGLSSLATAVTILLMGLWFEKISGLRSYGTYSFITAVIIFITGGASSVGGAHQQSVRWRLRKVGHRSVLAMVTRNSAEGVLFRSVERTATIPPKNSVA